ncbi:reverse transcriptase domain-containing protein [Tanacetum coccineum]
MSYFSEAASELRPYHFTYPERKLTMEEMLYKFIEEGKREHEEMRAFICDFQTTNEIFLKERNNLLIELIFGVQELLKVINNTPTIDCEVKGVTTRGGKTTTQDAQNDDTNIHTEELQEIEEGKEEAQQKKFLENLKQLHINLPFIEALAQMPKYDKFLKGLLTNMDRLEEACMITMNERCTTVLLNKLPSKEKDPGSFTIPYDIDQLHINNALADLGASISLMPYTMYEKLRLDFIILDMPKDSRVPIILGRPFLATTRAMIDVFNKKITLRVGDDEVIFDVDQSIKRPPTEDDECYEIDDLDDTINVEAQELLVKEEPDSFLSRGLEKSIDQSDLEGYELVKCKTENDFKSEEPIRRIASINMPYPVVQEIAEPAKIEREHLYSASANEIDKKKPDSWVSPIHIVPKKGGMTVVLNDDNELILSLTVTRWRVCIDYRKLNDATQKDHFPLPFIDQMLERLCANEYYCFLDGFSGFFQIPIALEHQEKTTFTCPYGTFSYRRMPFGLCNAPATFQRCMTVIFHDIVEDFMEVFIDDFSVFGNSFDCCLATLDRMLARCEETNLVLNWEKCHFMVKEGIVLEHKISGTGIEVDRAKIDVIAKLPYPTNVKGVRNAKFDLFDDCKKAFNILKEKLTTAPIIILPDWNIPFELMCDTSDFAVGAVLGQRIDGKFKTIYYANKTLNNAQEHYTTTEKELLAVVFSFDKFRPYLVLSKTIVYIDHSDLKYSFSKQDAKPRLIRWVLLLQGFDIKIKDKRGAKNLVVDHLSRLENPDLGTFTKVEIADEFPDEHLMALKIELNNDEPCASVTGRKVYESVFYWPTIFKDAKDSVMRCDAC